MKTILGIDGGGTKTTLLMVDEDDRELARLETGPSNYNSVGPEASRKALVEGIERLPQLPDIVSAGFAGAGHAAGVRHYLSVLNDLLPSARVIVESDAHIAYVGALGSEPGVVLLAGTGSIVIGRDKDGRSFRYGGWGPQFGDEGGGYWIGREAIRTALAFHEDGRDSDFPRFIAHALGVDRIGDVIPAWTAGEIGVQHVAGLTQPLTDRFPDEPGAGILKVAAEQLRRLVERGTIRFGPMSVPVFALGSVAIQPVIRNLIGIGFAEPVATPEQGAITWAREKLGSNTGR